MVLDQQSQLAEMEKNRKGLLTESKITLGAFSCSMFAPNAEILRPLNTFAMFHLA